MKIILFLSTFLLFSLVCSGQVKTPNKTRSTLQKEFINKKFIQQQKTPVKINNSETMDSLFFVIESAWKNVAPDTLKKYEVNMSLKEFENFDAYNYIWLLTSMTQDLNIVDRFGEDLINGYMIPALFRDFELIRKNPSIENIKIMDVGSLGNTLSIGSSSLYQEKTFLSIYNAFTDFNNLVQSLPKTDTAVNNYANNQAISISRFYYDFNARNSFYNGDLERSYNYLVEGLNKKQYGAGRAVSFSKKLIESINTPENKDKCFALLNTLALNTTSESMNTDTLLSLYLKIDKEIGREKYNDLIEKLNVSAFKKSNTIIKIPSIWQTINNISIPGIKKVKYILIDLWYTSCGPCLAEIPELTKFYEKYKNREDILFLSVNTDYINGKGTEVYVKGRLKDLKINFPVVYDNEIKKLSSQLNINSYPSKIILNNEGEIITKTDNSTITLESFELLIKEIK